MDHAPTDRPELADAPPEVGDPEPPPADAAESRPRWRSGRLGCAVEIVQTLALTLALFFGIQAFVAQPFKVDQHSMERTFVQGDYVLVDRLTPRWAPYARGQVVVFQPSEAWTNRKEPYIKRVIGVGGDTVEIRDGAVWVNGRRLDEPYLYRDESGAIEPTIPIDQSRWVVPDGELFVMGDHRQLSSDSREFGTIPVSSVIGRGILRYWPLSELGIIETPTYAP